MIGAFLAAAALAGSCPATPVHGEPLPQSGMLSGLRWVQATPHRAGIVGMLFGYDPRLEDPAAPTFALWAHGEAPEGWSTKILWIVRNVGVTGEIAIHGRELGGAATFRQSFSSVRDISAQPAKGYEYASIVNLPHGGCWRLTVSTGRAHGTLIVKAVEPS